MSTSMNSPAVSIGPEGDGGAAKIAGGDDDDQQQQRQQQSSFTSTDSHSSESNHDSADGGNPVVVVMRSAALSSSGADAERNRGSLLSEDSFFTGHDAPAAAGAVSSSSTAAMAGLGSLPTSASPSGAAGAGSPIPPVSSSAPAERKESYKAQRKNYAKQRKRVGKELLSTFKDQSIIVLADWLKIRGSLKSWTKLWCIIKPGLLLIYRSQKAKSSHWIGTIMLSTCELIERPSKKDGFCFKLFHPMDMSIWASRGPEGEAIGAVSQPLPTSHLIFRAPNNAAGKCWMDALELALRCSSLLLRTMTSTNGATSDGAGGQQQMSAGNGNGTALATTASGGISGRLASGESGHDDSDMENHFKSELEGDFGNQSSGCEQRRSTENDEDAMEDDFDLEDIDCEDEDDEDDDECDSDYSEDSAGDHATNGKEDEISPEAAATEYQDDPHAEVFGAASDQTEEISDENKSIVWFLVKQVRPGMDLSRVVLPTFILEPRSFLDKLSDHYYHADLLSEAVKENSPLMRMRKVVKWYLSGLYKKPKGLKKPYNPIIGETFRCYWQHPNGSKTFYISEQVSHHPPISAFYVTNRREGFTVGSSILAKSKFYGNSTSAILEGTGKVSLLPRGEDYLMTMPYAHCKGILMGTMTMELGGKITIECGKTGYNVELEFKLRPFLGGGEFTNAVSGKLRLGKETLFTIDGHWDDTVSIKDKKTGQEEVLWQVTPEVRAERLPRFTVPLEAQGEFESVRLWRHVSKAIGEDDQVGATEEKSKLEEEQRAGARERKATEEEWVPRLFELDAISEQYEYKHADLRPWDDLNDQHQFERGFIVCTKTKHKTPMIRTQSIVSVSEHANKDSAVASAKEEKGAAAKASIKTRRRKKVSSISMAEAAKAKRDPQDSTASTIPEEPCMMTEAPSSLMSSSANRRRQQLAMINSSSGSGGSVNGERVGRGEEATDGGSGNMTVKSFSEALKPLEEQQRLTNERLAKLQHGVEVMSYQQREQRDASNALMNREVMLVCLLVVVLQVLLNWFLRHYQDHDPSPPVLPPPPPPPPSVQ